MRPSDALVNVCANFYPGARKMQNVFSKKFQKSFATAKSVWAASSGNQR